MVVEFRDSFDLLPIPVTPRAAARQAVVIRAKVEQAGSYEAAVSAAVEAILRPQRDGPTELGRLRALYASAYTESELRTLVMNTFSELGIQPEGD